MSADVFKTAAGTLAWNAPANWSLAAVPGPGDDVTINVPPSLDSITASGSSTVTIASTDPAYTVQSLSMSGTTHNPFANQLTVAGGLTVTGVTSLDSSVLTVSHGGTATLGTTELGDYGDVELERHDLIWAEGAATETFLDDDSRGAFQNAAEFVSLYGEVLRADAVFCAPRVTDGHALEALRMRLSGRAAA